MKKYLVFFFVAAAVILSGTALVFAEGSKSGCGVEQMESLGEDEYLTDSGEIVQMEDIGGGDKMTDSGDIYQSYGSGDGELATAEGGLVSVDE